MYKLEYSWSIRKMPVFSLIAVSIISGAIWHWEIMYLGWAGLKWITYQHSAFIVIYGLFIAWLLSVSDELSMGKRIGFVVLAAGYTYIVLSAIAFFIAIRYATGFDGMLMQLQWGDLFEKMQQAIYILPVVFVTGGYVLCRIFYEDLRYRLFIISIMIIYASVPLSLFLLSFLHGSIYGYLITTDFIHTIKVGIIIPFILFGAGVPFIVKEEWTIISEDEVTVLSHRPI